MTMPNSDDAAEMDQFRDQLGEFETIITADNGTTIEYVCGEGDEPFIKYRLNIESIAEITAEEYEDIKASVSAAKSAAAE